MFRSGTQRQTRIYTHAQIDGKRIKLTTSGLRIQELLYITIFNQKGTAIKFNYMKDIAVLLATKEVSRRQT